MGPRLRLVLVCMCLLFAPGITGRAQPIGELMKPDRMVIRGVTAFAPEQIRNGLCGNQEFGLAAKPTMPATEYLELVRRQLLAGYSRSGYGQSQITVTVDQEENARRVIVDIQEGPLAVCGPVRVTGVPEETTAVICRSLAGEQGTPESAEQREGIGDEGSFVAFEEVAAEPRPDDPFWPAGTPANLHESGQRKIRQRVQAILSDEGFGGAEVESRCELEGQQAVLHVQVCGLTDPAVIAELQVTGNDRDTDQEVLQYLGLQIGQPWTVHEQYRVLRSLWMSARFRETRLRAEMAADGAHVMIDVRDYGAAPKLTGEFSREEAALLKLREWLVSGEGKSKDFVWQSDFKNFLLNCIVSARHGMLVEFAAGRDEEARQRAKHIVYFGPQELRIYAYSNQSRFTQAGWGLMLTFLLRAKIGEDPKTLKPRQFDAAYRFKSAEPGGRSRFLGLALDMSPVYFISMAHEKAVRQEWNGHELTIVTTSSCIRLDERTGQLLESRLFERGSEDEVLTGTVAENALQQRLEQVAAETANWSAFPSRERGLSSTLEFLGTLKPRELYFKWFRQQLPEAFELLPLAGRLAQLGLFEPLEPLTQQRPTNEQPRFGIPSDLIHVQGYSQMLALFLLYQSQDHFDLGTWPWLAWKCRLQRSCGMQCNAEAAAELLANDPQAGPLACFFVASALEKGSRASERVAALGLQRLSREAYLEDCRVLLDPSQLSGTCLLRCCQVLMTLAPEEIRLLESYVGSRGALAQIAKVSARHAEEVHAGAWEAAASELWDEWLAQHLEERLHFLHGINPLLASPFPLPPIER